jgi:group I intron endonuclease
MGAVFALFAGFYYWTPKIVGRTYSDFLGKIHFWTLFIGVNLKANLYFDQRVSFFSALWTGTPAFNLFTAYVTNLAGEKGKRVINKNNNYSEGYPNNYHLFFENVKSSKRDIYKQLKGKSGVYLFINNITNGMYVGSSLYLSKRMAYHFYQANSNKDTKIVFYRAMRKYKLENFSLAILDFCISDIIVCSNLEQKWIDYYKPRYNIFKIVGSSSGFRHSIETLNKLKEIFRKENHPKYGSVTSIETRRAISKGIKDFYLHNTHPYKGLKGIISPQYGIRGFCVFFYNKNGNELIFPSINGAKNYFKVR